jgi:hypothetical protein
MRHGLSIASISCALVLLASLPLFPQSPTATVNGQVRDTSGAVVQDADVQLVNELTNVRYPARTNRDGIYSIVSIPPGPYRIQVSKAGFKTIIQSNIVLNVLDARAINFELPVGAVSQIVTVEAGAPMVDTESPTVSTVIDRNFAENLPMNGRSFQTLIELTPGVVLTPTNGIDDGQFSVNGQRAASNYWMVDGVSANVGVGNATLGLGEGVGAALPGLSVQGGTNSLVSVDAMEEFRIQTATFAPEFGRAPGGQISIVTRSGTNQFHGTAFDYLRNDVFDANDWFANFTNQPKPEERQNDFGGTFDGPVLKDRAFFFISYEGLRLRLPQVAHSIVPSVAARQSATPATQSLLSAFPVPNGADLGNGSAQFNASFSNASSLDATSLRLDHKMNDRLTLFARYNYSPSRLLLRSGSMLQRVANTIQTATIGSMLAPSPAITNEVRFNYSRSGSGASYGLDNFGGAIPLAASALNFPRPYTSGNALFDMLVFSPLLFLYDGKQGSFLQQQYNLIDNVTIQKGSHTLKFGADYRRLSPYFSPRLYQPVFAFLDIPSLETGQLFYSDIISSRHVTLTLQNLGMFAEDVWRIGSRLTLTYGLRWDVDFAPTGSPALPALTNFNPNNLSTVSLAPSGAPAFSTTYNNVAPRLGVAYRMSQRQGRETVFRGGFGVFFDLATQGLGNVLNNTSTYPFGADSFTCCEVSSYPLPSAELAPPSISTATLSVSGVSTFDPNLKLPHTFQWNVALEQALGPYQTMSASYIGSRGRRLLQSGYAFSPNSTFAAVQFVTNSATSDYEALQLQFQRRLSHDLQALGSYTWSHSIDTASAGSVFGNYANAFVPGLNPNANRGPSDFDIRSTVSAGITYGIPTIRGNAVLKAVLGDWSLESVIQARSAPPVNVFFSGFEFSNKVNAAIAIRPDAVGSEPLYLYGSQCLAAPPGGLGAPCPGGKGFNPSAFTAPPRDANGNPTRQGDLPRNALRGFGAAQWDFAVHRDFPIHESFKLQFRAEMFNVLNHPNFGQPIGDLGSPGFMNPQFGQSIQTLANYLSSSPGVGGQSPLYQLGGARSIQLALKLQF